MTPVFDSAQAYVTALTGNLNAILDWRGIHDVDKGRAGRIRTGSLAQVWAELVQWQTEGFGIFCMINGTDGLGREIQNVTTLRTHVVDLDDVATSAAAYAATMAWSLKPHFSVWTSPGKYHVYWLADPYGSQEGGAQRYNVVQRKLIKQFGSDHRIWDVTRVLRVPGFYHLKNPAEPHLIAIYAGTAGDGPRYSLASFEQALSGVVDDGASGGDDTGLGDPKLSAPSLELLRAAVDRLDPNALDRSEWIKMTAAFKQAGWVFGEAVVRPIWDAWCAKYEGNDPAENDKQWRSIRSTKAGWPALLKASGLAATAMFGNGPGSMPTPVAGQPSGPGSSAQMPVGAPQQPVAVEAPPKPELMPMPDDGRVTGSISPLEIAQTIWENKWPIAFDICAGRVVKRSNMPWEQGQNAADVPWTDADDTGLQMWFNSKGFKPAHDNVVRAVRFIADRNKFDPVAHYLTSLVWDGSPRINELFVTYFGAQNLDFARIVGSKFLIGMVARVMQPGCKRDEVIVLEGAQGIGKSRAASIIAGAAFFSDNLPNMHDKEASGHMSGKWVIEIPELSAMRRSHVEDVKAFISRPVDKFRPPYGRHEIEVPRRCVFIATTNDDQYLKDPTGNRRWWPIQCGSHPIDLQGLKADRDQLLAEAMHRFNAGENWWLTTEEQGAAAVEQEARQEVDAWFGAIEQYCATRGDQPITMENVVTMGLGIPYERQNCEMAKRVKNVLLRLGYKLARRAKQRFYIKAVEP